MPHIFENRSAIKPRFLLTSLICLHNLFPSTWESYTLLLFVTKVIAVFSFLIRPEWGQSSGSRWLCYYSKTKQSSGTFRNGLWSCNLLISERIYDAYLRLADGHSFAPVGFNIIISARQINWYQEILDKIWSLYQWLQSPEGKSVK